MTTTTLARTTITHRYPWTLEERVIIGFFALGPTVATVGLALLDDVTTFVAVVLHLCGLAAAGALYELGSTRKDASALEAELTGTVLQVTGGRVKRSRGDIASTRDAHTQEMGPETVLVLSGTGGAPLRVPARIAADPALAPVLRENLLRDDVLLSDDARRVIDSL